MGYRTFLGSFIVLILGLTILVKVNSLMFLDLAVSQYIQQIGFSGFAQFMYLLTFLGNPVPSFLVLVSFSFGLLALNRKLDLLFLIFSSAGATAVSELIKAVVSRPRPDPSLINQIGIFTRPDSFPSGHVMLYIGIYGYMLYLCHTRLEKGVIQTLLMVFLALILILIGVSRIYLGAHWFSDVLGSYLIGAAWIYVVILLESRLKGS